MTTDQPASDYYLPDVVGSPLEDPTADCTDHWTATSTSGAPDRPLLSHGSLDWQ